MDESAPFLVGVSAGRPNVDDNAGSENRSDAEDGADDGTDWNAEDFPEWYRDKVTGSESGGEPDSQSESGSEAEPESDSGPGYPFDLAAVQTLDRLRFGPVTVLAGDNGTGKSTIVEAIAVAAGFNAEGGSRNLRFNTFDTHSPLHEQLTLSWNSRPRWGWFLRAETFYGMASHIAADDDPYGGVAHIFPDLHNRSHGESFLDLARSRFTGRGLYMLDEPESALSNRGQMELIAVMAESLAQGSQFIISTHSPLLMAYPGAALYELDAEVGIEPTSFDDLEATNLWRRFFNDPASFYKMILDPDPATDPRR